MTFKDLIKEVGFDLFNEGRIRVKILFTSYLFNPSFRLLLNYRIGRYLFSSRHKIIRLFANRYRLRQITRRNCQISFKATIGKGLKLPHPLGIVIGDSVVIKDNVMIWQQVTLGSHGKKGVELNYPTIEDGVKIFAGARILGNVTVGKNSTIGANAVVLQNVPENCIAVGIPARILKKT